MAFKAINNTADLEGLVPTLLVFGALLCSKVTGTYRTGK